MKLIYKPIVTACLLILAPLAQAYVGPGAGLSAIGSLVALVFAILLLLIGFLWYPVKRLMKRKHDITNKNLGEEQPLDGVNEKNDI